jgi:acetyl esterase/lipase
VAFFKPGLPFDIRWRMLVLQPVLFLTYGLSCAPYIFSRPFTVEYLVIAPGRSIRALVYKAAGTGKGRRLRPLHVEIHSGAFIGGTGESMAVYDERVARETGAVVVSH